MRIIKNVIITLMSMGILFVGGEGLALQSQASSIETAISDTGIETVNTLVSEDETTTTTDTTTTTETSRLTALGEGITDIVTTEFTTNIESNVSTTGDNTTENSSTIATTINRTENSTRATTRISAWYETVIPIGTIKNGCSTTRATEGIQKPVDTTGIIATTTSTTTTTIGGAPATSDPTGLGAICTLIATGIIGGLLMINEKKQ